MNAMELTHEIFNALETQEARDWWNGMTNDGRNEFVCVAQEQGVSAAAKQVELCAEPEHYDT